MQKEDLDVNIGYNHESSNSDDNDKNSENEKNSDNENEDQEGNVDIQQNNRKFKEDENIYVILLL